MILIVQSHHPHHYQINLEGIINDRFLEEHFNLHKCEREDTGYKGREIGGGSGEKICRPGEKRRGWNNLKDVGERRRMRKLKNFEGRENQGMRGGRKEQEK